MDHGLSANNQLGPQEFSQDLWPGACLIKQPRRSAGSAAQTLRIASAALGATGPQTGLVSAMVAEPGPDPGKAQAEIVQELENAQEIARLQPRPPLQKHQFQNSASPGCRQRSSNLNVTTFRMAFG